MNTITFLRIIRTLVNAIVESEKKLPPNVPLDEDRLRRIARHIQTILAENNINEN